MTEHFGQLGFTHALTLAWNKNTSMQLARDDLKALDRLVNQALLGPRFHKKSMEERTLGVFVLEGLGRDGHLHAHSLWKIRHSSHLLPFSRLFPAERGGIWNQVVHPGSYKLSINNDWAAFASYALKQQHVNSEVDQVVWSLDFRRS